MKKPTKTPTISNLTVAVKNLEKEHAELIRVMWANDDKLGLRANDALAAIQKLEKQVSAAWQSANDVEALLCKANGRITALESWHKDHNEDKRARLTSVAAQYQFCVIGDMAKHQYPISRTWHNTQERAEEYAASIVRNSQTTEELLVVQVVSKVRRKEPDIKVMRV
jgi:hypothetical protein